jgi:PadR family transcriptional regulator PadR
MFHSDSWQSEDDMMAYDRLVRKTTRENLWLHILSALEEKPRYGYELRDEIRRRFGFESGEVTAYVVTYALKRDGYVTVKNEMPSTRGPSRKYYSLTPSGRALLEKARSYLKDLSERL